MKVKKLKKKTHKGTKKVLNIRQGGTISKQNVGNRKENSSKKN